MPKQDGTFEQRECREADRAGQRGQRYFGPHDIDIEPSGFGRNAKAHADNRCAEELGDEGADERQGESLI